MVSEAIAEAREAARDMSRHDTFLQLIGKYEPALRRLAGAYLEQGADREDLFQEIALALWQAIPGFRGDSSERTWLYRIAHNVAISSAAKVGRGQRRQEAIPESFDCPSGALDTEQELLRKERRRILLESVRGLPTADRQIVLLHMEGLSYAEIEEVSGLSESAIAARLTRIREKLRAKIQGTEVGSNERSR